VVRGDRIFVTGAARNGAYSDIVTMGYTADGEIFSVKSFESQFGLNDKPTAMGIDLDENLIVVGQMQDTTGNFRNVTFKYSVWEKPIVPVYVDSVPAYNQNEVIIRFDKSAMKLTAVNKKDFEAGELHEFVHQYVIDSMNAKFPFDAGKLPTYKIFRRLTTADSLSITRLGDTIKVPAFWATLSVMMPEGYNEFDLIDSLNTLSPIVQYGEVNGFIKATSVPNDPIYENFQASLHPALLPTPNPNNIDLVNHINIEGAWDIETGDKKIVVGVFDENIYWQHPDLQVVQSTSSIPELSNTKVVNGKNYYSLNSITAEPIPSHYHGTAVAGIIGALRNNGIGIAGIAGGDVAINPDNYGVEFISFGILKNNLFLFVGNGASVGLSTTAWEAMLEGALQTTNTFGYGVHLQNLSWQMMNSYPQAYYINTLQQVVYCAWKNQSVLVAARGNNPTPGQGSPTSTMFPACTDDRMILSVGASGTNGLWKNTSNGTPSNWQTFYGQQMDFLAPGVIAMVSTFSSPNFPSPDINIWPSNYRPFDGTSAATPHVTGVSALMLSKHNYPNKLATEDVEQILQKSARIAQNVILNNPNYVQADWINSYDYQNAFGLIDAQVALEYVNLPNYFVRHSQPSDILSSSVSLAAQNVSINLTHEDHHFYNNYLTPGNYVADKYEATWVIQVELPANHEIIDFWPLFSKSCGGFKKPLWDFEYSINHFEHFSFEPSLEDIYFGNTNIGFGTNTLNTITVKATYYFVKYVNNPQQTPVNKWLPECGTNNPNQLIPFSFSLHIRENNELSTPENQISQLQIFPNPTDNTLILKLSNQPIQEIVVFDLQGRVIFQENKSGTSNNSQIDVSGFINGIYIVQVTSDHGIVSSSKFIKK
jgi:subtilisin family serine protease